MRASRMNRPCVKTHRMRKLFPTDCCFARVLSISLVLVCIFMGRLQRVINKIRAIVCEEIASAGGLEITMPIMQEQACGRRLVVGQVFKRLEPC